METSAKDKAEAERRRRMDRRERRSADEMRIGGIGEIQQERRSEEERRKTARDSVVKS